MRSKVHPKYKTKYRVGNWSAYEQALVQRGDVTLGLSADATDAWRPSPSGRPGAPKTFSDCAIETALTLRLVFRVPVRHAEGFWRSVLSLMGVDLAAPDLWVANYYSARNPLRLSSLVILGVVARMFRCATRSSCWCT